MPIVFLLCTVGAFASASRLFDIYAMLADRHRRVLPAPARLRDGAARAGPRARAAAGQEPAPRPGAVGRQHRAVLHPADRAWPSRRSRSSPSCCTCPPSRPRSAACARGIMQRRAAAFVAARLKLQSRCRFALCNEVLQPLPFAAAVRARRRRSAMTAWRSRRSRSRDDPMRNHRRARRAGFAASRGPRPGRSPACTGCWSRRPGCRSSVADAALRERTLATS